MPYISNRVLHTNQNPNDPNFSGAILEETDPQGTFVLVGKRKFISDKDAERWGLIGHEAISETTLEAVRDAHDAKNRATYGDGGVSMKPPREPVAPKPEAAEAKAPEAKAGEDAGEANDEKHDGKSGDENPTRRRSRRH